MYRPFSKSNVFYSKFWNERRYQTPKIFPTPEHKNLIICVSGIGVTKDFSCIITDMLPDLELIGKSQCFPLYWYEEKKSSKYKPTLFDIADDKSTAEKKPEYKKHDGITDYILLKARRQYASDAITKEDIFYYVYGLLHSSQYRRQFAADLKKMLPRIVLVDNAADFKAFCKAGRALAKLHLDYEHQSKPDGVIVEYGAKVDYLVGDKKMKFKSKLDKSELRYNSSITIKNIPAEAYEYVVNGRSAIEWIIERYHITQDKKSLIVNNPNDWAKEHDDPQYILKLLLSIITVSIETVKIVRALPQVKFEGV